MRVTGILTAVAVPVMLLVALVSWGFASPIGASPDDDYHMASIWCGGGTDDLCQKGLAEGEMKVPEILIKNSSCFAFHPETSGACSETPSSELVNTARGNFVGGYPPVFYAAMSVFSGSDIATSVLLMRAFNALLFVVITTTLFFLLPRGRRGPLVWGTAITLVPLGMFLIPSVNPSSWAVLSAVALWVSLVAYFTATERKKQIAFGAIAVVATLVGAGARSDSAVYAGLAIVVAIVLTAERSRRYALLAILPAVLSLLAIVFFLTAGQSSVLSLETAPSGTTSVDTLSLALANLVLLPELWSGALGTTGLGWVDTAMPGIVWVSTLAAFFSLVFWGLQKMGVRKAIALFLIFASLVAVPLYVLVKDQVLVGAGVQPRYIYPLMIMLAGIALWKLKRDELQLNRLQLVIIAILLPVANSVALHTNLRRYVTGIDAYGANLDVGIEWWWQIPVSPMAVWIIGSLAFGIAVAGILLYTISRTPPLTAQASASRLAN